MTPELPVLLERAAELLTGCRGQGLRIATAESCTGGLIAALLTEIPGSSDVLECGFVTYSNAAKTEMLNVNPRLIEEHGAVSAEVARAMAEGALANSRADLAVAVTGIAGPGGGTPTKPVGLVYLAAARRSRGINCRELRTGDIGRSAIRLVAVSEAFTLLHGLL